MQTALPQKPSNLAFLEIAVTLRFSQNSEVNFWLNNHRLNSLPK